MTLDITIGELCLSEEIDYLKEDPEIRPCLWVRECPELDYDLCDPDATVYPRTSYRSGSTGFWKFCFDFMDDVYYEMRENPKTNELDIAYIKPFLNRINKLSDPQDDFYHKDRMKWLKFWCNKAVELYGDRACIMFA